MRATDRARDRAVGKLRTAYLSGALSTDTFELRTAVAYGSRTDEELSSVVGDLPSLSERLGRMVRKVADWLFEPVGADAVPDARIVELPRTKGQRLFIGRHERCDVVVDNPGVSRWHLEITYDGQAWEARDLASTNGTFVRERRISAAQPLPDDVVYLGRTPVRLVGPNAPAGGAGVR